MQPAAKKRVWTHSRKAPSAKRAPGPPHARPPALCRPGKSSAPDRRGRNAVEPIQGRIHIEKIIEPFLFRDGGSPAEYGAGLKLAIERGWLKMHESGTFVTFTPAGAELFA
jgi:hypothetical protein